MQKAFDIYKFTRDHCTKKGANRRYLYALLFVMFLLTNDRREFDSDIYDLAIKKGLDLKILDQKYHDYFENDAKRLNQMADRYDREEEFPAYPAKQILENVRGFNCYDFIEALAIALEGGINQYSRNKDTMELIDVVSKMGNGSKTLLCGMDIIRYIMVKLVSDTSSDQIYYIEEEYIEKLVKSAMRPISLKNELPSIDNIILRILMQLDIKVRYTNDDIKFDRIIDLGTFSYPHGTDVDRGGDSLFKKFTRRIDLLEDGGKCVCNIAEGITTLRKYSELRKRLIDKGLVETLISLPAKIAGLTNIFMSSSSIMLLSKGNEKISFIDANKLCTDDERHNHLNRDQVWMIKSILDYEADGTIEGSYAIKTKSELLDSHNDHSLSPKLNTLVRSNATEDDVKISDVAKIFRGMPMSKEELDERAIGSEDKDIEQKAIYITQANIDDDHLLNDAVTIIKTDGYDAGDMYLKEGDIIMSKNGSMIKNALFDLSLSPDVYTKYKVIPSENLYVIRPVGHYQDLDISKKDIANVIFCHINSKDGIEELRKSSNTSIIKQYLPSRDNEDRVKRSTGAALTTISKKNLQELSISLKYYKIEDLREELPDHLSMLAHAKKGYAHRKKRLDNLFNSE